MKKLSLFLLGCFSVAVVSAQSITPEMFVLTKNTGSNMTVGINSTTFDQFAGGQVAAFFDLNGNGVIDEGPIYGSTENTECVGLYDITSGFMGLALWGDDSSTPDLDGLATGAVPQFAILHGGNVILVDEIPAFTGFIGNGIVNIENADLTGPEGCTDIAACNVMSMYSDVAYSDDGSCTFADAGYNCAGECLADADADGVCDEFEVAGCTNDSACNYDGAATDDDGSCTLADAGYDCDGVCLNDADLDGVCDEFEVVGCQDDAYDNYDASATDAGDCTGLLGCTDAAYFEYTASSEVDNGSCATLIIPGCTNPSSGNYLACANLNIPSGDQGACLSDGGAPPGCTIPGYVDYNPYSNDWDSPPFNCNGVPFCTTLLEYGCTYYNSENYNPNAHVDDGSCIPNNYNLYPIEINFANYLEIHYPYLVINDSLNLDAAYNFSYENESMLISGSQIINLDGIQFISDLYSLEISNCNSLIEIPELPNSYYVFVHNNNLLSYFPQSQSTNNFIFDNPNLFCVNANIDDGWMYNFSPPFLGYYTNLNLNHPCISLCDINELSGPKYQELYFPEGWSMFSTYMDTWLNTIPLLLDNLVDNNYIEIVKNNNGEAYLPEWDYDGIGQINLGSAYQIKTNSSCELLICGDYIDNDLYPIALTSGWNMMGYLRLESANTELVLNDLTQNNNLVIAKDDFGNAFLPEWDYNGIGEMLPGKGYQLKVNEDIVFNYLSNDLCYSEINYDCNGNFDVQIGDYAFGGIVFYIDSTGEHGLVVSDNNNNNNNSSTYMWGCSFEEITGADGFELGTGFQNTLDIISGCNQENIAATVCSSFLHENYDDWYLPSIYELELMVNTVGHQDAELGNIIQLESAMYWSSSEENLQFAKKINSGSKIILNDSKGNFNRVRPIRSF